MKYFIQSSMQTLKHLLKRNSEPNYREIEINVKELFLQQYINNEFNRYDIIVRLLAIEEYYGKNNVGFELYKKMQLARNPQNDVEEYINKFKELIVSWEKTGYQKESFIDTDAQLYIEDGAHRLAMALYWKTDIVSCRVLKRNAKTVYSKQWFIVNDFEEEELELMDKRLQQLTEECRQPISVVVWPAVYKYFDEIADKLSRMYEVRSYQEYSFSGQAFEGAIKGIYHIDDIIAENVRKKVLALTKYENKTIRIFEVIIPYPKFRLKEANGHTILCQGEVIKNLFRRSYKNKLKEYYFDVIMHTGDNFYQSHYILNLFKAEIPLKKIFQSIKELEWMIIKSENDYMPKDFPEHYPFSKDIDIICTKECFQSICDVIQNVLSGIDKEFGIRIIDEQSRKKVRVESEGWLIFQMDISYAVEGMTEQFVRESLQRRCFIERGYYLPSKKDEIVYRTYEYIQYPQKRWHLEYIQNNKEFVDIQQIKKSLIGNEWDIKIDELEKEINEEN